MAKFSATAALLFCLISISLASIPPENDNVTTSIAIPLPKDSSTFEPINADVTTSIAIPLPKVSSTFEPINAETESNSTTVTAVPLTTVTFRPINRRFRVRSKKPCRHHFKVDPTVRVKPEEIPYGNDMIISSGENSDFDDLEMVHGGERRGVRLHHHHHHHHDEDSDSDSDDEDDKNERIVFKRYNYDRLDRGKKLKSLYKIRKHFRLQNEENKKKKNSGFMKRVNDFLDHYF